MSFLIEGENVKKERGGSSNDPPRNEFVYELFYLGVRRMEYVAVIVVFRMNSSLHEMDVGGVEFAATESPSQRSGNHHFLALDDYRLLSFVSWDEGEVRFCSILVVEKVELGQELVEIVQGR